MQFDPGTTALVVVDMQNDFCDPNGYYASVGRAVEPIREAIVPIGRLLAAFRATEDPTVVFTRLVYDDRLPSVEQRHDIVPRRWVARDRRLQPDSWGSEIVSDLAPGDGDFVLDKTGYSAFFDTGLASLLRRRRVRTVVLSGTVSYACVLSTAFDAFDRDLDVVVAADAVSAWFDHLHGATLEIIDLLLGRSATTDEVLAALTGPPTLLRDVEEAT